MPSVQTAGVAAVCGVLKLCQNRNPSGITATYTVKATQPPMTTQLQSNRESARLAPLWLRTSGVVVVVVMVTLVMPLAVALGMVVVLVMMFMRYARILAEDERLDRHRNRKRRHTHAA